MPAIPFFLPLKNLTTYRADSRCSNFATVFSVKWSVISTFFDCTCFFSNSPNSGKKSLWKVLNFPILLPESRYNLQSLQIRSLKTTFTLTDVKQGWS